MTSRELTSGFDFWSRGHLRMAMVHLPIKLGVDIYIQSRVIDICSKFKMAAAAILDFQFMWIWPFRRVDSVVFVFCAKFGSNTCYSHWDRRTCFRHSFDDVTRINFRFRLLVIWSSPRDSDASSYIIWCKISLSSPDFFLHFFPKFKMAAAAILDFQFMWIWLFPCVDSVVFVFCTKFCSNICYSHWDRRTYASDLHLMTSRELASGFNFWSRVISAWTWSIFPWNLVHISLPNPELLIFFHN